MRIFSIFISAMVLFFSPLLADDDSTSVEELFNQVMYLEFDARLLSAEGEVLWQVENRAYTISGRTVDVRLEGGNVLAISRLTPYLQGRESILLVAQGEVWYNLNKGDEAKYYSGMTSIPIKLGESALFFPLGINNSNKSEAFKIEIEITIDRYARLNENS